MTIREDIATAASTVEGINVTPSWRTVSKEGEGFVRFVGMEPADNGFGWVNTWEVVVALSQTVESCETWLDTKLNLLMSALQRELQVTSAAPYELNLGGSITTNAVVVSGTRGHDG